MPKHTPAKRRKNAAERAVKTAFLRQSNASRKKKSSSRKKKKSTS